MLKRVEPRHQAGFFFGNRGCAYLLSLGSWWLFIQKHIAIISGEITKRIPKIAYINSHTANNMLARIPHRGLKPIFWAIIATTTPTRIFNRIAIRTKTPFPNPPHREWENFWPRWAGGRKPENSPATKKLDKWNSTTTTFCQRFAYKVI